MNDRGFTIVEVMIAILVLTVGLLGLMGTAALVTRMIARGQRSAVAAVYASARFERLRATACTARADGSEQFYRGGTVVGRNDWTWTTVKATAFGQERYQLKLKTTYVITAGRSRVDSLEATISCVR